MTSPLLNSYEDRTLHTTWQITFDRIQQQIIASAKLLKLWAYFDRQQLWFDLLRHAHSEDESIQKLTEDELNFNEAIILLHNFGLVDLDPSPQQQVRPEGYSLHSCVHSWTVSVLNEEWYESLARLALNCVASEVPSIKEKYSWLLQRRLLQHATRQALFIVEGKVDINGLSWVFFRLGNLYSDQGKLAEAEKMYDQALQGYEEAFGPDHTTTLDTVHNLGIVYANQGKLAEAEAMYERALQGSEDALSLELVSSYSPALNIMFAFGNLFSQTDRKDMAKAMYNRALFGYKTVQGPSSKQCKQIEDMLQALQVVSAESKVSQDEFTEPEAAKSRPSKQKFRELGRRLHIG